MSRFALEVAVDSAWVRCVHGDGEARFSSREDAECEARWSLDEDADWRVVEVSK